MDVSEEVEIMGLLLQIKVLYIGIYNYALQLLQLKSADIF